MATYSYGIPDGTYMGRPTTASCFEKDGTLILDINFAVINPETGEPYKKDNGYDFEAKKRHWLTNKEGGFNEATINGIKEWAKGWNPTAFADFWWFQQPDANGTPFGNLLAIGDVELNFKLDRAGNQQLWVHDPNRVRGGRTAYVPDGGTADTAALAAKWGAKAKALFAASPKKLGSAPAAPAAPKAPAAPARPAAPSRPAAPVKSPSVDFPQTPDGAFAYFCSKLGEPYESAKHDERWFAIYDDVANGMDPDQFGPGDIKDLFKAVDDAFSIG